MPIGPWELMIILAICVLLFGARRLPEIGSGIGEAIRNFKSGISGEKKEIDVTPDERKDQVTDGKPGA
jgi:sec-independent protein translocase protein TatA